MKLLTIMNILGWLIIITLPSCKEDKQTEASRRVIKVPELALLKMDSSGILRTDSIPKGKPIVFMFFESDCPHCQDEISSITSNAPLSKDWRIVMISRQPLDSLKSFSSRNNLSEFENITVCKDTGMIFWNVFKMTSIPSSVIYAEDGKLRSRWDGSITINDLKKLLGKKAG